MLKSTAILTPSESDLYKSDYSKSLHGSTYEVNLPADYLHMLNCVCIYEVNNGCKDKYQGYAAKRLTGDSWSAILTDYYNKPTYKNPYYYLHNVNSVNDGSLPTNPSYTDGKINKYGTDISGDYNSEENPNLPIKIGGYSDVVYKNTAERVGNPTEFVRCEIRCGKNKQPYILKEVHIDYLKVPQYVNIT